MSHAQIKITNPDEIIAAITLTLTLKDWRELRAQLAQRWPAWHLSNAIDELIGKAERQFYTIEPLLGTQDGHHPSHKMIAGFDPDGSQLCARCGQSDLMPEGTALLGKPCPKADV